MLAYSDQIVGDGDRREFLRDMGRTVIEAFLRQDSPPADSDGRSLFDALRPRSVDRLIEDEFRAIALRLYDYNASRSTNAACGITGMRSTNASNAASPLTRTAEAHSASATR